MRAIEIRWPPWPYRAGFCITDDTDTAELASVRAVYDFLSARGVRTTKTVWALRPTEPCGIPPLPASIQRGVTLEDPDYLAYCGELNARGFEIALHGASAGNNRRAAIERAFEIMDRHFAPARTYVCHAKNADNPYWQEKIVARGPLRLLLSLYAGRHRCAGEDPVSPYFWGDLCRRRVRFVRLLRTARINTLAANPSMPYHESEKPYVPYWFSATKRSLRDCTAVPALDDLERSDGACVLYQYLCRYADAASGGVTPAFRDAVERLATRPALWVDTAGAILDRLRLVNGVWLATRGPEAWVVNANDEEVRDLQIATEAVAAAPLPEGTRSATGLLIVDRLPPGALHRMRFAEEVKGRGRRAIALDPLGRGRGDFGHGETFVNAGEGPWRVAAGFTVAPGTLAVRFAAGLEELRPTSRAADAELTALFLDQARIILREFAFKGRPLNSDRWLSQKTIELEDHDRW